MYIHCGSKLVDSGFESSFEKRVEHRVQEIWRTLQETNINLSLCDQLLDDFSQHCYNNSTVDCSTQTSFRQTTHLQDELSTKHESKYVCSNLVSNELKEDFKTTCVALNDDKKDNLNSENKKASVVDLCTNIIHSIQEEIQDMRHALEISSGHQLKENLSLSISRLETCCHDLFFVFRHKNSNEEFHWQSHVTTCQIQDETFENLRQLLQEEKLRRQRAESLLDEAQMKLDSLEESYRLSKGESEVRLGQLSTRVCNLAQTVHGEQERVQRLQDSRCRLVQYLHVLSCSLSKEHRKNRIMANQATSSLYRQPSPGAEEADRLRARIKHLRHVLRTSGNHRVQRLKMVVVKLRSLCHSVERRYQGMLYLLGRQVQNIAESMCGTSLSTIQPLLPSLSPTQMAHWFLQVQSLAEWIQDHVTSLPALLTSMRQHDHVKMEQSEVSGEALVNNDKQLVPTVTAIPEYGWSSTLKSSSENCSRNSLKSPKHLCKRSSPTSKELHEHCFTSELEDNSSIQCNSHLKSSKGLCHGSDKQNELNTESISKGIPNKCIVPEHDLSRGHLYSTDFPTASTAISGTSFNSKNKLTCNQTKNIENMPCFQQRYLFSRNHSSGLETNLNISSNQYDVLTSSEEKTSHNDDVFALENISNPKIWFNNNDEEKSNFDNLSGPENYKSKLHVSLVPTKNKMISKSEGNHVPFMDSMNVSLFLSNSRIDAGKSQNVEDQNKYIVYSKDILEMNQSIKNEDVDRPTNSCSGNLMEGVITRSMKNSMQSGQQQMDQDINSYLKNKVTGILDNLRVKLLEET